MPKKDTPTGAISAQAQQDLVSDGIENFELPKSVVTKIAKSAKIPDNTKLQKEAVLSLLKGSTVFINFLAATAHDVAISKQHKSISTADVFKALEMIGFADMADPLQDELAAYRELQKSDKGKKSSASTSKSKKTDSASAPATASKTKGKEKATTAPLMSRAPLVRPGESVSSAKAQDTMDVDEEEAPNEKLQDGGVPQDDSKTASEQS